MILAVILGGVGVYGTLAKENDVSEVDLVDACIQESIVETIKVQGQTIRADAINEATEKIKVELERREAERLEKERLEAEKREAERLEALRKEEEKKKTSYTRPIVNSSSAIPGDKYIALTFDDGPSSNTGRLLDVLNSYNAKATFFVMGRKIKNNPSVLNRMINEGHQIGGHSWSHPQFTAISEEALRSQIMDTRDKISSVTGADTTLVRPPYGSVDSEVKAVGADLGVSFINWSVDSLDWKSQNAKIIYYDIMTKVKNGSIILCHDTHSTTVEAMEQVIPDLIAQGYHFVTVSELLGSTTPGVAYYNG